MKNNEFIMILKQIQACLKYEDWITEKGYVNIEIKRIKRR